VHWLVTLGDAYCKLLKDIQTEKQGCKKKVAHTVLLLILTLLTTKNCVIKFHNDAVIVQGILPEKSVHKSAKSLLNFIGNIEYNFKGVIFDCPFCKIN